MPRRSAIIKLIDDGSDIAGAGATGMAASIFTTPVGGLIVGIASVGAIKVVKHVGKEIAKRYLGPREKIRIGATATFALLKINENLQNGMPLRTDNFFSNENGRSKADEIFEGALLSAKNSHEEKKAKLLGAIYANIAFSDIPADEANLVLKYVTDATYRGLLCLALIQRKANFSLPIANYNNRTNMQVSTLGILHEFYDLYNNFLIYQSTAESAVPQALFGIAEIIPANLFLRPLGRIMCTLASMNEIPAEEIESIIVSHL